MQLKLSAIFIQYLNFTLVVRLQLLGIKNDRIDAFLDEISNMILCELPTYESWSIELFLANTKVGLPVL